MSDEMPGWAVAAALGAWVGAIGTLILIARERREKKRQRRITLQKMQLLLAGLRTAMSQAFKYEGAAFAASFRNACWRQLYSIEEIMAESVGFRSSKRLLSHLIEAAYDALGGEPYMMRELDRAQLKTYEQLDDRTQAALERLLCEQHANLLSRLLACYATHGTNLMVMLRRRCWTRLAAKLKRMLRVR